MKRHTLFACIFIACLSVNILIMPVAAEQLLNEDFQQPFFAKTVDFFEYARAWAVLKGLPKPPDHWNANVYMTYINQSGFQLVYAGLQDISLAQNIDLTIPMQTILMHYKTQEDTQDALVASSFLMVMGFNDTDSSLHTGSPDKQDNLWASFSLGINVTELFPDTIFPAFNSGAEILELTYSTDTGVDTWEWGMKYKNLTALWITIDQTNEENTDTNRPYGLATYDELTFKYKLTLSDGTATLHKDYTLGQMHDLFVFGGWLLIWPIYNHYNSTGCYRYNAKVSDETVYDFLEEHEVSMSVVEYQKVILLEKATQTVTSDGDDVSETEVNCSDSSLLTYSEDGELICDTDFRTKPEYLLYNLSTTDPTSHKAIVRTHDIEGYAKKRDLFKFQTSFQQYIPLILVGMYPKLFQRAQESITNIATADCLYIISYPNYGGYKIDHDPVFTAYYAPIKAFDFFSNLKVPLMLTTIVLLVIVTVTLIRKRMTPSIP
ncbi:MAG: hypothetical protein JSV20_07495 [Candidatus Bathyarchaeota archaeon]|nr:MAG: hypothetical protein JSV20_07495 [Candidatus Bathyarchaeota archaeon]